jgi:LmbE family N-acetylglucosaminyl deacetylase
MSSERGRMARAGLRAANGLGSRGAESLWASVSHLAGAWSRHAQTRRWASSGRERVVVIAPHPDDEAVGCAGTLIRHHKSGDLVRITVMTDGSQSRAFGFDAASMRRLREAEAFRAAARMGASCDWVGLREGDWSDDNGRAAVLRVLRETDPTVIYAPSFIDYHPEHRRVAKTVAAVLADVDVALEVRMYAVQVPLTPLLTNLVHDVSDLEASIGSVFACYPSQRESLTPTLRLRRYAARFYGATTQVEGFCAIPAPAYASLHGRPPARFRSLAARAWMDPLAMLVGSAERIRWSRFARKLFHEALPRGHEFCGWPK